MNFKELAATLRNGFHDAELRRLDMDYVQRRLRLDLDIWIGDMSDAAARDLYRSAQVVLERIDFLVIEPPDDRFSQLDFDSIRIDTGEGRPPQSSSNVPSPSAGNTLTWLFLIDLNTFVLFSAGNASLEWAAAEQSRE